MERERILLLKSEASDLHPPRKEGRPKARREGETEESEEEVTTTAFVLTWIGGFSLGIVVGFVVGFVKGIDS